MVGRGEELLTSWLAAFPVRTLVWQEREPESKASEAECGKRWYGLFARFDHQKLKWRTPQCSLLEDWTLFSETWPRWGSMRNGECFLRNPVDFLTDESGSGSRELVPTPTACDHKGSGRPRLERGPNNNLRDFCKINFKLQYPPVKPVEWLMWWPIGHTDLKPLETAKYREWQQQHSICSHEVKNAA
jgi:hypothetical protein